MKCVNCGKEGANRGSGKHPYCQKCFTEIWKDNIEWYYDWLCQHLISGISDRDYVKEKEGSQ